VSPVRVLLMAVFVVALIVTVLMMIIAPDSNLTFVAEGVVVVLLAVVVITGLSSMIAPRRARAPRSQVAEIERLYFRAMREMLTDNPNYAQVINDLQRILSIDPRYKNARHYYNRALILRNESSVERNGTRPGTKADFLRLQEKLVDLDPAVRKSVVMDLIQYGEISVDPLIALLMDDDADVRVHAATALGWVGGPDAVQPLLVALMDSNLGVRRYAARALCWVVDESAVEGLITALSDEDSYVRSYAARALGWSQDERAVEPLKNLLDDENSDVRSYAAVALEDLGHKQPGTRTTELAQV
ncbi:MAG: HEAT repeat domain-containing protein, partial [Anaerolineae bacterium]|nr:HEAT repeat domain-containing protein [Anaerolineae bacterium]